MEYTKMMMTSLLFTLALFANASPNKNPPISFGAPPPPVATTQPPVATTQPPVVYPPVATTQPPVVPLPQLPPVKCNTCMNPMITQTSTVDISIKPCQFEIAYDIVPFDNQLQTVATLHYFSREVVVMQCPGTIMVDHQNEVLDFPHVAEFVCDGRNMKFDLYLPVLHMLGLNKSVTVNVNGDDVVLNL
jgi:hypothetical protein